ncbi:RNA polymerase-associated protein RapA [Congregibacter variabilis]|uniref:RNA polymerase-associated protein RapA n=1 Tax=Congregibacter variabilis TaxID=3081200 RepID=A0ABZ0I3Y2_9GAMM|nr:RNA polymerase-associated protein RapA [Congregibacter sp. IMCC43200]
MSYAIGQRWLSHADSELGLGIIVELDGRRVSVHFPAVEEERTYATENAPLTRVKLREGDSLHTRDGRKLQVLAVHEEQELLIYEVASDGQRELVAELDLDDHIDLATPRQRLLASQIDSHSAFALRMQTCTHIHELQQSGLRGLLGTRTALLPHQLFVANEVGKRHAPRVLLADEVGLGKTIEAGMILHRQLLSGDSRRVLIMVPESLQFQWLVEMRRRFNLQFALFDESRLAEGDEGLNPFEEEQLVLCASTLFLDPNARALALDADWDMLIVDEVHRLAWSADAPSEEFLFLETMAAQVPGLLLLTATPEQVGQEAHFARLSLLDPERFHDFPAFVEEESQYKRWSTLIDALDKGEPAQGLPADIDPNASAESQIAALLDRYGTGRVLFRNARASVGGFPAREMHPHPLPAVDNPIYQDLYPDLHIDTEQWLQEDPRVAWLVGQLKSLRPEKVLVICAKAETALALESYLQLRAGIRSAAFHEQLSLIERDRAAAYFAEQEQGAQALICSEIGGEGRNFQFAQHLILFDLPEHPDQLEQRIGRLDRIGQRDRIFIHVPYIQGSAQETLMRWYHEGIDLFRASCSAGDMILTKFKIELEKQLRQRGPDFDQLLEQTATFTARTRKELSEGRDKLLERSSCNAEQGLALGKAISDIEDPVSLGEYLETLCAVTGIEHEEHGEHSSILRRGEQELLEVFPEVPEDGCTVTVSRDLALQREDWIFLGWEHPWMENAMTTVLGSSLGQASVGAMTLKGVPGGSRLYELLFTVSLSAPRALGLQRYLPLAPRRLLLDANGRDLSKLLSHERLNERVEKLPRGTVSKIVRQLREEIEARIDDAEKSFASELEARQAEAAAQYGKKLDEEIARLSSLREVNPAIRREEIDDLRDRRAAGLAALGTARATLQGVRLVLSR